MSTTGVLALLAVLAVGFVILLCFLAVPLRYIFISLLLIRSVTDAPFIPDSIQLAVNSGVGILALVTVSRLRVRKVPLAWLMVGIAFVFSFALAASNFGLSIALVGEAPRLTSIICVFILAREIASAYGYVLALTDVRRCLIPAMLVAFAQQVVPALALETGRSSGTFVHPNAAVVAFNVGALLSLHLFLEHRQRRDLIWLAAFCSAALLTLSLGGLAALAVGCAYLILRAKRLSATNKMLTGLLAAFVAVLVYYFTPLQDRLDEYDNERVATDYGSQPNSLQWRFENWVAYLHYWRERPLLGWGWGTTEAHLSPLGRQPHGEWVKILVETGIVGAVLALALFAFLVQWLNRVRRASAADCNMLTAILLGLVVQASESNMLSYTASLWFVAATFGIVAGSVNLDTKGSMVDGAAKRRKANGSLDISHYSHP